MNRIERPIRQSISLPKLGEKAYFPNKEINKYLAKEIISRAGESNLVYAIEYGSHVSGDATPTSMHDVMIIVDDPKKFHEDGLKLHGSDYGNPHLAKWHAFLNTFGFNFYHSHVRGEKNQIFPVKLAVISKENFIKGCSGTFKNPSDDRKGAFGMYVSGRIQKAALSPLYKRDDQNAAEIESAINAARIDGVWFALGLLDKRFTFEELLQTYVALSYKADARVEKKAKAETLVEKSRQDYVTMLQSIIDSFIEQGLIKEDVYGWGYGSPEGYEKIVSLQKKEVNKRLLELKAYAFAVNFLKNWMPPGIIHSLTYASAKVARSIDSYRHKPKKSKDLQR